MRRLPRLILAGQRRRVTFFYTTGERLLQARTLADLRADASECRVLWRAARAGRAARRVSRAAPLLEVPPEAAECGFFGIFGMSRFRCMERLFIRGEHPAYANSLLRYFCGHTLGQVHQKHIRPFILPIACCNCNHQIFPIW